jgi:thioredoxin reductase
MTQRFDLLVIGAGPAGASAAIAAAGQGLSVAVLEENREAGGQIYRAPTLAGAGAPEGDRLRASLEKSGARLLANRSVWHVAPGFVVQTASAAGLERFTAERLVVATGTSERIVPVPGAELPGVIGLAAATIAIKAHLTVPAGPTLVAGAGPLLYAVATGLLDAGGKVAAVVDLARPAEWLARMPALASRPRLLAQGMAWMVRLRVAGVRVHFGSAVTRIEGRERIEAAWIAPVDGEGRATFAASRLDVADVVLGHGLIPATETTRALGAIHTFAPARGGWVPDVDEDQQSSVSGLYLAGDCTGIWGGDAAQLAGRVAGLAAARDAGALSSEAYASRVDGLRRELRTTRRFGAAMAGLMALRPRLIDQITPDTIVCRCEDVPRAVIDAAAAKGARHVNQLKSATRCGMGPCQGRLCGEAAAEILARACGLERRAVGQWTPRSPLRPLAVDTLIGEFDYADIGKS